MTSLAIALLTVLSAEPTQEISATMVFTRASNSVVMVKGKLGTGDVQGSGVIVAKDRVVTNLHVVSGATELVVRVGGVDLPATVLARSNAKQDLALLSVTLPVGTRIAKLRAVKDVAVGEHVFAIGNPRGLERTLSEGLVSALRPEGKTNVIQTTAAISPGSSGGGLFDARSRLVGITTSMRKDSQSLNFAHPTEWVLELLAGKSEAPSAISTTWTVSKRPQNLLCQLVDRSVWGLFSEGLELLQTEPEKDQVLLASVDASTARVISERGDDRDVVLTDMSRQSQVAFFSGAPESVLVAFEDDGVIRASLASQTKERGVPRLVTRSGDCVPMSAEDGERAIRGARSARGERQAGGQTTENCESDPSACYASARKVEGGERFLLMKKACRSGHGPACREAITLAEQVGDLAGSNQLREWATRATIKTTPTAEQAPKVEEPDGGLKPRGRKPL